METKELNVVIRAITDNFTKGISDVNSKIDESTKGFGGITGSILKANFAFQGIQSAVSGLSNIFSESVDQTMQFTRETKMLMNATGMTAEQASGLATVLDRFGIDANGASVAIKTFSKQIESTADPTSKTKTAFENLGISVRDSNGQLKSTNDLFLDVSNKFETMSNGADKTALAVQLFGKQGVNLIPVLNLGKDKINELEQTAASLGMTLTGDNVKAITNYNAAQHDMNEAISGAKLQIGLALMPAITNIIKSILSWIEKNGGLEKIFKEKVIPVVKSVTDIIKTLGKIIVESIGYYEKHKSEINLLVSVFASLFIAIKIVSGGFALFKEVKGIISDVKAAWTALTALMEANPIILIITAIIAVGLLLITHWNTVKKVADDVWKWITKVATDFWDWIKANWPLLLAILTGPFGLAVLEIVKHWNDIINFFKTIGSDIVKALKDAGTWLYDTGKNIINGLINGIKSVVDNVGKTIKDGVKGGIDSVKSLLGIHSPSKVFMEIGQNMGQGLINGITSMQNAAQQATADLANASINGAGSVINNTSNQSINVSVNTGNLYGLPTTAGQDLGSSLANQLRLASRGF